MKFYIIRLSDNQYLKYISKYYLNVTNDPLKAKKFKTFKTAVAKRDQSASHAYYPCPESKILELSVEIKELDA